MPFNIPKLPELTSAVGSLRARYDVLRKEKDSQRFFVARWLSGATSVRLDDISFLEKLVKDVADNKFCYHRFDSKYLGQDYSRGTATFLKQVIAGGLLLSLINIDRSYAALPSLFGSAKDNSVLASAILNVFGINDLGDVSKDEGLACLEALRRYTLKLEEAFPREHLRWHPTKENEALREEIDAAMHTMNTTVRLAAS